MSAIGVFVPALYTLLNNAGGRPSGVSVHTFVPEDVDQPYIRVGEIIETPGKPFGKQGYNELQRVHAFSRHRGGQQCRSMVAWADQVMDGTRISVTGFGSVALKVVDRTVTEDPDGTFHGILTVRARPISA